MPAPLMRGNSMFAILASPSSAADAVSVHRCLCLIRKQVRFITGIAIVSMVQKKLTYLVKFVSLSPKVNQNQ